MDWVTFSASVGPIATVLAAGGYVMRLEGKIKTHDQMLVDRDKRLDEIKAQVDKLVDHLIDKKAA